MDMNIDYSYGDCADADKVVDKVDDDSNCCSNDCITRQTIPAYLIYRTVVSSRTVVFT